MQITLPIPATIPRDVLLADPVAFLKLERGNEGPATKNLLTRVRGGIKVHGITAMWMLLTLDVSDVLKWKNFGRKATALLDGRLSAHNFELGQLHELRSALERIDEDITYAIDVVTRMNDDTFRARCPTEFQGMFHPKMTFDELIRCIPAAGAPLTDAQVAFLRCDALKAFGLTCSSPLTDHTNVFDASFLHEIGCDDGTVWDAMLVLMHLQNGAFGGSPARLRKKIGDVLGPLPLALAPHDLARILAID